MEPKVLLIDKLFNKGSYKYNPGDHKHDREGIGHAGEEAVEQKRRSSHQNKCRPADCSMQEVHTCVCGNYLPIRAIRTTVNTTLLFMKWEADLTVGYHFLFYCSGTRVNTELQGVGVLEKIVILFKLFLSMSWLGKSLLSCNYYNTQNFSYLNGKFKIRG